MKKLKLIIILALVAGTSGLVLSLMNDITQPIIIKAQEVAELELYETLFPDMTSLDKQEVNSGSVTHASQIMDANGPIGFIYTASGKNGYGGITALIAIDTNDNIIGIEYTAFNQTPGFGDKIQEENYLNQFNQMSTSDVKIDGATGATYSSNLVKNLVEDAAKYHNTNN
ncbi:MAG: FMN-binding protein [Spiroplasma sp.]|nr:FMN-binding protein [Mycoplasmatales bacterium]